RFAEAARYRACASRRLRAIALALRGGCALSRLRFAEAARYRACASRRLRAIALALRGGCALSRLRFAEAARYRACASRRLRAIALALRGGCALSRLRFARAARYRACASRRLRAIALALRGWWCRSERETNRIHCPSPQGHPKKRKPIGRFSPTKPIGTTTNGHWVAEAMKASWPCGVCPRSPLIFGG